MQISSLEKTVKRLTTGALIALLLSACIPDSVAKPSVSPADNLPHAGKIVTPEGREPVKLSPELAAQLLRSLIDGGLTNFNLYVSGCGLTYSDLQEFLTAAVGDTGINESSLFRQRYDGQDFYFGYPYVNSTPETYRRSMGNEYSAMIEKYGAFTFTNTPGVTSNIVINLFFGAQMHRGISPIEKDKAGNIWGNFEVNLDDADCPSAGGPVV